MFYFQLIVLVRPRRSTEAVARAPTVRMPADGEPWGDDFYFTKRRPDFANPHGSWILHCNVHAADVGPTGHPLYCQREHRMSDAIDETLCKARLKLWAVSCARGLQRSDHKQKFKTTDPDVGCRKYPSAIGDIPCEDFLVALRDAL